MKSVKNNKTEVLDYCIYRITMVLMIVIAFVFALEEIFLSDYFSISVSILMYYGLGSIAGLFTFLCLIRRRSEIKADIVLLIIFVIHAFISSWISFGFSNRIYHSHFYFVWAVLIFLFVSVRFSEKSDKIIAVFGTVFEISVFAFCLFTLVYATRSLNEEIPGCNRLLGCFRVGRLCALNNAIILAFFCLAASAFAYYGWLRGNRKQRVLHSIVIFVLWFVTGLANSRTVTIAYSAAAAVFAFGYVRMKKEKDGLSETRRNIKAVLISICILAALLISFRLPTIFYRGGIRAYACISGNRLLLDNTELVHDRSVTDTETLTDRGEIWKRSLELIFMNPRRTFFGISVLSEEAVNGAYEGRHDIPMAMAHNGFLEIWRKCGLIGLLLLTAFLTVIIKRVLRILFDKDQSLTALYMASVVLGFLLTGVTELGPFPHQDFRGVSLMFFLACGYCMKTAKT